MDKEQLHTLLVKESEENGIKDKMFGWKFKKTETNDVILNNNSYIRNKSN